MLISGVLNVREINQQKREDKRAQALRDLNQGKQLSLVGNKFARNYILDLKDSPRKLTLKLERGVSINLIVIKTQEMACGLCLEAKDDDGFLYKVSCLRFQRTMTGSIQRIETKDG